MLFYRSVFSVCLFLSFFCVEAQTILFGHESDTVLPLQQVAVVNAKGTSMKVFDGNGREYFSAPLNGTPLFQAGGALGTQVVRIYDKNKKVTDSIRFVLDAHTKIDDKGYYKQMFDLFYRGMFADVKEGTFPIEWNGKMYHVVVPWVLDNYHTMKGLKYFLPNGNELVDIMRQSQRSDGMIYSFIQHMNNVDYYLTRDKYTGYSKKIGDKVFVRQPTENHPEYVYVNTIYECWKADGNDQWMKKNLESARRALDYAMSDPARWSKRFGLLKRVYTIDSWDFAVEDEYMPDLGITNTMIIDPVKSKFGVFFGDNTGYIAACYQLSEMIARSGDAAIAEKYKDRGDLLRQRLNKLSWNGNFFTHFIDEDSSVHRHLGVDEKSQLAQSNAYSLNRSISHEQSKAIIESYLHLKNNLPKGSPGEWYAIYPPFQRGFEKHDAMWQYMNGGVGGHVAGELARGASENGYEKYGTDILNRLFELGKKYDNKIWFAYTGAMLPPPPAPVYKPLDISAQANMDNWTKGSKNALPWMNSKREGDALHNLPVGRQTFDSIRFNVIDASKNDRRSVVAVSRQKGFPAEVSIPVNDTAACIYLLHTASKPSSEDLVGAVKIVYEDGSDQLQYIRMGKQLTYWWFSELQTDHSGIAWYGKNAVAEGVGLSWCALDNPHPSKKISKIVLLSGEDDCIYTVFAVTLANQKHYVPVKPTSFGGPDDWAASTAMAAMVEGLAGIKDAEGSEAFTQPVVAPRWPTTSADTVNVTVRYAASEGYISYRYIRDQKNTNLKVTATTGGRKILFHILTPENSTPVSVTSQNKSVPFTTSAIEQSHYADFTADVKGVQTFEIKYK